MTDAPAPRPRLVFVIGAPRSGTTWLQNLLGSHPAVVTPQETDLFSTFVGPLQATWDTQIARAASDPVGRRAKGLPAVLTDDEFHALVGAFVDGVFDRIRAVAPSSSVIVEKSPSHSRFTAVIRRHVPDAAFIHVIRDGRDVAGSLLAAGQGWGSYWAPKTYARAAEAWKSSVLAAREAAAADYVEVRYEALRAHDTGSLRRAFGQCGIEVGDDECRRLLDEYSLDRMASGASASSIVLSGAMAGHHGQDEPAGFFGAGRTGGDTAAWDRADRLLFDAVAGDLLVELGYEMDHDWAGSRLARARYRVATRARALPLKAARRVGRGAARRLARLP